MSANAADKNVIDTAKTARELAEGQQYKKAIDKANSALTQLGSPNKNEDKHIAYLINNDLCSWYRNLHQLDNAIKHCQRGVDLLKPIEQKYASGYANALNNLGLSYTDQGELDLAKQSYTKAYEAYHKLHGDKHEHTLVVLNNLANGYLLLEDYKKAEELFVKAKKSTQDLYGNKGSEYLEAGINVVRIAIKQDDFAKAETLLKELDPLARKLEKTSPKSSAELLLMQGRLNRRLSNISLAGEKLQKAYGLISKKTNSDNKLLLALIQNEQGILRILQGRFVEAEKLFKNCQAIYKDLYGKTHSTLATNYHNLGLVYSELNNIDLARQYYDRSLHILKLRFGEDSPRYAQTLAEQAGFLADLPGEYKSALAKANEAISILENHGSDYDYLKAIGYAGKGEATFNLNRLKESKAATNKSLEILSRLRGKQSSDLPPGLLRLGKIYLKEKNYSKAEEVLKQAIAIRKKDQATTPFGLAKSMNVLAKVRIKQKRFDDALSLSDEIIQIMQARLGVAQSALSSSALGEQRNARYLFEDYLHVTNAIQKQYKNSAVIDKKSFLVAQYPQLTDTAAAINQMTTRFVPEQKNLAKLVRQRQDLLQEWRSLDSLLNKATTDQSIQIDGQTKNKMEMTLGKLKRLDEQLSKQFPQYTELTSPSPVDHTAMMKYLDSDEALFTHVTTEERTYLFLLTKSKLHVATTGLTNKQLEKAALSIRDGLNIQKHESMKKLPPFDVKSAHLLHKSLFAPFEKVLAQNKIKHINVIFDGAMQNLPPALLLEKPFTGSIDNYKRFKEMSFLGKKYAFSMLPSVSSLKVLRDIKKSRPAQKSFIGYGDPDLALAAGDKGVVKRGGSLADVTSQLKVNINPRTLRKLFSPLPETKQELEAIAKTLGVSNENVHLGNNATEAKVKSAALNQYRTIAFATHGLLVGEFQGLAEPALVLTPPNRATPLDDGLLTASEIAKLDLNADWVILSACNTAGTSGKSGAEGLSGLAKGFFFAGARSLLVSHWSVDSSTTVILTTNMFKSLAKDPSLGRAEALQQSMINLIDKGKKEYYAHPIFWAPFVVVGEGEI